MSKLINTLDPFELAIAADYDAGEFVSTAPNAERLSRFKAAAKATVITCMPHQYVTERLIKKSLVFLCEL